MCHGAMGYQLSVSVANRLTQSMTGHHTQPYPILHHIEDITMVVFVLDYLIRVLSVHAVPQR